MLAYFFWDPNPIAFHIPFLNHPIAWYGVIFAGAFLLGYFIARWAAQEHFNGDSKLATAFTDRLLWFSIIGTVVGARLGHVLFYEWDRYSVRPLDIFKTWEGGLASHGAVIGILIALAIFRTTLKKFPKTTFLQITDIGTLPTAIIAVFIRFGNFVNQELVGTPSNLPWAVLFGHPSEGLSPLPRHPVQLYESAAYLFTFVTLIFTYRLLRRRPGLMTGLFLVQVFTYRLLLEFFKQPLHSSLSDDSLLTMGQLLSIPFIVGGLGLIILKTLRPKAA